MLRGAQSTVGRSLCFVTTFAGVCKGSVNRPLTECLRDRSSGTGKASQLFRSRLFRLPMTPVFMIRTSERASKAFSLIGSVLSAAVVWYGLRSRAFIATFAGAVVLGWTWLVLRWIVFAGAYERTLEKELELGDDSSQFQEVLGVQVHFKRQEAPTSGRPASPLAARGSGLMLLHGFGASLFSFYPIMEILADNLRAPVLAFDRPGFGLTERPSGFDKYSTSFEAKLVLKLAEQQGLDELVLCGHSMGTYDACLATAREPKRVRALVLIAPAVPPPTATMTTVRRRAPSKPIGLSMWMQHALAVPQDIPDPNSLLFCFVSSSRISQHAQILRSKALRGMVVLLRLLWSLLLQALWYIALPLLIPLLRITVSTVTFWQRSLEFAVYEKTKVTAERVEGYQHPRRVRGWERGLLAFTWSQLGASVNSARVISGDGSEGSAVYDRVSALKIPTLIIHGESDLIVPLRIGQRVADSIAGSTLVVLPKCGHLPHEELPEEVADIIQRFLANLDDV